MTLPERIEPCPKGFTDYEACFAPFRYCPEKGCGRAEGNVQLPTEHHPQHPFDPEGVQTEGSRVFLRLGNYEFEVVVPPTLQTAAGHLPAAQSTASLLSEKLAEYREAAYRDGWDTAYSEGQQRDE